jgi:hypothetical protein
MFQRFLFGFLLLLALVWSVLYLSAAAALRREAIEAWPYGLGSLQEAVARTPPQWSPESEQLATLVEPFNDVDADPAAAYVEAQVAKKDDAIDPPPADVQLTENEANVAELVRFVVANGDRLTWRSHYVPGATELLAAAALDRARSGDAAAAWNDLHAIWILTRALAPTSGWRSKEQALIAVRHAAAIARKLPPPAPLWLAEIAAFDPRRQTAVIMQDSAMLRMNRRRRHGVDIVFQPFFDYARAGELRRSRVAAEAMAASTPCRSGSGKREVFRASRIEAEIEGTTKVLALKAERARLGRWPAALPGGGGSRCAWEYRVEPDGSYMALWLSYGLGPEPDAKTAPALRFSY